MNKRVVGCLAILFCGYASVRGQSVDSEWLYFATNFNAVVFGDFTAAGGDTEFRLAVCGTTTFTSGYSVGMPVTGLPLPAYTNATTDMLISCGDLHDGAFGVNGNIVYGGTRYGPTRYMLNGNVVEQVTNITFDASGNVSRDGTGSTQAELLGHARSVSAAMAVLPESGVKIKDFSSPWQRFLTGTNGTLNVFNVTAVAWSMKSSQVVINAPAGSTVLVNIIGDTVAITNSSIKLVGVNQNHVIYNYPDATWISTKSFLHRGSVLAPYASAALSGGAVNGTAVFGGDVTTTIGFEFHNFPYSGCAIGAIGTVNSSPSAVDQTIGTAEDTPVSIRLSGTDPEFDPLTFTVITTPEHGTLTGEGADYVYTPAADYYGYDEVKFSVSDASLTSSAGTVHIAISAVNDAPVLSIPAAQAVSSGGCLFFNETNSISVYDVDVGENLMQFSMCIEKGVLSFGSTNGLTWLDETMGNPTNQIVLGTLVDLNTALADLTYTPTDDGNEVELTLVVEDMGNTGSGGNQSDTQSIPILVTAPPRDIAAFNQTVFLLEDTEATVKLMGYEAQGRDLTFTIFGEPEHGEWFYSFAWSSATGFDYVHTSNSLEIVYMPDPDYHGRDIMNFVVDNGDMESDAATVTFVVLPVNDEPQAIPVSVQVDQGTSSHFLVFGTDLDGDSLTFEITTAPQHGTAAIVPESAMSNSVVVVYTPYPEYSGTDSFMFIANDGRLVSQEVSADITVHPLNFSVDAGPDQTFEAPGDLSLAGCIQGLNEIPGAKTNIVWSRLYGPGVVSFADSGSLLTTASFTTPGTYVLKLSATYSGVTRSDTTTIVVWSTHSSHALMSSRGIEFWLGYLGNFDILGGSRGKGWNYGNFNVTVTSEFDTLGILTWFEETYNNDDSSDELTVFEERSVSFAVRAGIPTLLKDIESLKLGLGSDLRLMESDVVAWNALRLTADDPVSVSVTEYSSYSTDTYLALPTGMLGTNYLVMTYANSPAFNNTNRVIGGTEFVVVSRTDDTHVTIVPTSGASSRVAGVPYEVTLQAGEDYRLVNEEDRDADLTGTQIISDKPIAVFGGNKVATVPGITAAADHLCEQMPPVNKWGSRFLTLPLATRSNGDTFRILAAENGTEVVVNGIAVAMLNRGEFHECIISAPAEIVANHPVLVAQFAHSSAYDDSTGDPSMLLVPAVEQYAKTYIFATPKTLDFTENTFVDIYENYVNVVVPAEGLDSLLHNGCPVSPDVFAPIGESGFWGAQIPIDAGAHSLEASAPFCTYVYGWAEYESYANMAGLHYEPTLDESQRLMLQLMQTTSFAEVGSEKTLVARVVDDSGNPVPDIRIQFEVEGANVCMGWGQTNPGGDATFSYFGGNPGVDLIKATCFNVLSSVTNTWLLPSANHAPVLTMPSILHAHPGTWFVVSGAVSDDALPVGSSLQVDWRVLTCWKQPQLRAYGAASATVWFPISGVYVLEVTASDGELSTRSLVSVVVNELPVVTLCALTQMHVGHGDLSCLLEPGENPLVGQSVRLEMTISDEDGFFTSAELFDGDVKVGAVVPTNNATVTTSRNNSPYYFDLVITNVDAHAYSVVVTDNVGEKTRSNCIEFEGCQFNLTLGQDAEMSLVGNQKSVFASVTTLDGEPIPMVSVDFAVGGSNPKTGDAFTGDFGKAIYTYTGRNKGVDVIEASLLGQKVTVTNSWVEYSGNQPPVIEADDYQIALPNRPFTPTVSVVDDGTPTDQLSVYWRILSGPSGTVPVISNPDSLSTVMSFSSSRSYYELELVVSDSVFSSRVVINVYVDDPPVFEPLDIYRDGLQVLVCGSVTDFEGSDVTFDLFEGDTYLQTTSASYCDWQTSWFDFEITCQRNGDLVFTVQATDEAGNVSVSDPIHVTVDLLPTLTWSTPTTETGLVAGSPVVLSVQADAANGTVTNVAYYLQGESALELLGNGVGTSFACEWLPLAAGEHVLMAIATDDDGYSSGYVTNRVNVDAGDMRGTIISPVDGTSVYCSDRVGIELALENASGRYQYAELFANGNSLGQTLGTTFEWVPGQLGDVVLSAIIHDSLGESHQADNTVEVHVMAPPVPEITLTQPTAGSRIRAYHETLLRASLVDPASGVTNLCYLVNGVVVGRGGESFVWTPQQPGVNTLCCVALTSEGQSISSETVSVNVVEMFAPSVCMVSPTNTQWFAVGSIPLLRAEASDADGAVCSLDVLLDDLIVGATNASALEVIAEAVSPGWHSASARATDNDGLSAQSAEVRFFAERFENTELPVPGNLRAETLSASEIQLAWELIPTNDIIRDVIVERWNPTQLLWLEIAEVPASRTIYHDSDLSPETNYRYRIACVDTNGWRSAYSAETNATTRTVVPYYAALDLNEALAGLLDTSASGGNMPSSPDLTHYDSRLAQPLGRLHAEAILGEQAPVLGRAVARFNQTWPQIRLDFDPVLLSPQSIMPTLGYLTGPGGSGITVSESTAQQFDPTDPITPVSAFLQEHHALFGFGPEALDDASITRDYVSPVTGTQTLVWQQQVADVPVFNACFIAHITTNAELAAISSAFVPDPFDSADPTALLAVIDGAGFPVESAAALLYAVRNVGDRLDMTDIQAVGNSVGFSRAQSFTAAKGIKGKAHVELTWFPVSRNDLQLAWQVIYTSQWRGEMYLTLVSVRDGSIFYRRNLTVEGTPATYRVFETASPAPISPGLPEPASVQPDTVGRALVTLAALDENASPLGWIADGDNETRGNNVEAHLDHNDDDSPDLPRPAGSPMRVFDFPLALPSDPVAFGEAATVQLFFWNNWMHDVLYRVGFTEASGNFQADNFGNGGLDGDPMQADAQDGLSLDDRRHRDHARISVPPDGYAPRMQIQVFAGATPDRDASFDAEVILHEYAHGLSIRSVGGGIGIDAIQSAGLGEGWSDFFALALLTAPDADPDASYPIGSYVAYHGFGTSFDQNAYFGLRRYPYSTDMSKNPLTFADIDPAQASPHSEVSRNPLSGAFSASLAGEVHQQGEVWCVMLWEMRANLIKKHGYELGHDLALLIVAEGMRLSPRNPSFVQARDAILLADRMLSDGANAPEIWTAFSKRGLGYGAKAPWSRTTDGVVASTEMPPVLVPEYFEVFGGNGDGLVGTNELNVVVLSLRNQGSGIATGVGVSFSTSTPGVQIVPAGAAYGDIQPNQSVANQNPIRIQTEPGFVNGTPVEINISIHSDQGDAIQAITLFTGPAGTMLPPGLNPSLLNSAPLTAGSAEMKDLTPWDLGNLEPLWMAEDGSALLKAATGKYVLWSPHGNYRVMSHPGFLAHRLTRHGVVVGELAMPPTLDAFGDVLKNSVGAIWLPDAPAPVPATTGLYAFPKTASLGEFVGVAYDLLNLTEYNEPFFLGGVGVYPTLHSLWDYNAQGQAAGAASVYLRPEDSDDNGVIDTDEVIQTPMQYKEFNASGEMCWMRSDERVMSAGYSENGIRRVYYNSFTTSAARFDSPVDWWWLGPLNTTAGSAFSLALHLNDDGDVAGTASRRTGNPAIDAYGANCVFRWSPSDGEFGFDAAHIRPLGMPAGAIHSFPFAMNQAGDIAGYVDYSIYNFSLLHAVFWPADGTEPQELGVLAGFPQAPRGHSVAFALNEKRQVVGTSWKTDRVSGSMMNAGVLWQWNASQGGTPRWEVTDLDLRVCDPDVRILNAVGISSNGWILAYAERTLRDVNGNVQSKELRAVILLNGDLDVDSDNDGGLFGVPDHLDGEDRIEDDDSLPGRILSVNDGDSDGDGIPGFADGYGRDANDASCLDSLGDRFAQMVLELPRGIDLSVARLAFVYSASDPAGVMRTANLPPVFEPAPGELRIWTKGANARRSGKSVFDGAAPGDFVPSGSAASPSAFGFAESADGAPSVRTFHVEAVRPSAVVGGGRILVRLDLDGPGPLGWTDLDAVRMTAWHFALVPDFDRDGVIDETDRRRVAEKGIFRFWINDDRDFGFWGTQALEDGPEGSCEEQSWIDKLWAVIQFWNDKFCERDRNAKDKTVNGVRDLVDFFPLRVDVPPRSFPLALTYRLSQSGGAVNFAYTALDPAAVGDLQTTECASGFGADRTQPAESATILQVTNAGIDIDGDWLNGRAQDQSSVVLMCEGRAVSTEPLILEVLNDGVIVCAVSLDLSLSSVKDMFRYLNVREGDVYFTQDSKRPATAGLWRSRLDEPPNLPDAYLLEDGAKQKTLVMVHGLDWDEAETPAGHSEIFKRLYQAGSNARYIGVSWTSDLSRRIPGPIVYANDVIGAFIAAPLVKNGLSGFLGPDTTIVVHSLGNVLVSSAIQDHRMAVGKYVMLNPAVPAEAYDGRAPASDPDRRNITHPDWLGTASNGSQDYPERVMAAGWSTLFSAGDPRHAVTWDNRFGGVLSATEVWQFYSTGEEILRKAEPGMPSVLGWEDAVNAGISTFNWLSPLEIPPLDSQTLVGGREWVWVYHEQSKGVLPLALASQIPFIDTKIPRHRSAGWAFNPDWFYDKLVGFDENGPVIKSVPMDPGVTSGLSTPQLIANPFFKAFNPDAHEHVESWYNPGAWIYKPNCETEVFNRLPSSVPDYSLDKMKNHAKLLAEMIPPLSSPAGGMRLKLETLPNGRAFDMHLAPFKDSTLWPDTRPGKSPKQQRDNQWLHGDYKDAPYRLTHKLYENITEISQKKQP